MRQISVWMQICTKRLLKKPFFVFVLVMMPLFVLALRNSSEDSSSIIRVGLYQKDTSDKIGSDILKNLKEDSNDAIRFEVCKSEEELRELVTKGVVQAGYCIEDDFTEKLGNYPQSAKPVIKAIRKKDEQTVKIVDEIVISQVYEYLAYEILCDFLREETEKEVGTTLWEAYDEYRQVEMPFRFEYEDGSVNTVLTENSVNIMMLPIKGSVGVLVFLAAMIGGIFWYTDNEKKICTWLSFARKEVIHVIYILVPAFLAGLVGILSLVFTGMYNPVFKEILLMFLYVLTVTMIICIFQVLVPKVIFVSAIPFFTVLNLIICPVFTDLKSIIPFVEYLRPVNPLFHYMNASYSMTGRMEFALYSGILFVVFLGIKYSHSKVCMV